MEIRGLAQGGAYPLSGGWDAPGFFRGELLHPGTLTTRAQYLYRYRAVSLAQKVGRHPTLFAARYAGASELT